MNIGERIKRLRKEKGLSVDYVAEKLGKNRATIYRYESNEIENLPYPILVPLADILGTTPMYLMGCEVEDIKVTNEEKRLLENYNKLNSNGKEKLIDYSDDLTTNIKYINNASADEISATTDNVTEVDFNSKNKEDDEEVFVPYKSLDEFECVASHYDDLTEEEQIEADRRVLEFLNKRKLAEFNKRKNNK